MGGVGEEKVELIGFWGSPFVKRVKWVLKMKGIEYEYVEEDLRNKSERLLSLNPVSNRVPVLVHNGKPIAESLVIIEYIEETWQHNPLLPVDDPFQRATARFWAKFVEDKFTEVVRKVLRLKGDQQEEAVKQAIEALDVLEGELNGKKFFGGDKVGLVDIVLGWATIWVGVIEEVSNVKLFESEKHPSLACWMENFIELPMVKEDLPPLRDQLPDYLHKIRKYGPSLLPPPQE
ncbi:Glutathione S-transferase, N-terminal [Dillenia turbinata]|uniref:glutathione transferase n=1 Tax=Dillenia turbinata TaxID=194707 RepID=A0AAN8V2C2_9MAGN